jgi:hypothetical protein
MYQPREKVNRTLAALTLSDGAALTVQIRLPLSNRLADALNNADPFLDVLTPGGEQQFISKSVIRTIRQMELPRAEQADLEARAAALATADPHVVLKVPRDAGPDQLREAYHRMARLYHPDRMASYELPDEMRDYARAMLVRINLAFEQLRR